MLQHKLYSSASIKGTVIIAIVTISTILANPIYYTMLNGDDFDNSNGNGDGEDKYDYDSHALGKRSFYDIQCRGIYNKSIFARVDQICEDCYNLYQEPRLHTLCRERCFTTNYFKGCMDSLLLTDESEKIQEWIKVLDGISTS